MHKPVAEKAHSRVTAFFRLTSAMREITEVGTTCRLPHFFLCLLLAWRRTVHNFCDSTPRDAGLVTRVYTLIGDRSLVSKSNAIISLRLSQSIGQYQSTVYATVQYPINLYNQYTVH